MPEANGDGIKAFMEAVGAARWNLDFRQWCARLGRDPMSLRSERLWHKWQELAAALAEFDPPSLEKLLAVQPEGE